MRLEKYKTEFNSSKTEFEFISEGPKGNIYKSVLFSKIKVKGLRNLYNLEFGDKNKATGEIDDFVITDNQDRDKVLATVVSAIFQFFQRHPKAQIFFTGSTPARTRLYRMAMSKYLSELSLNFVLFGLSQNGLTIFEKNRNYLAFIIRKKEK